ncbi:hypothetical protein ACQ4PT_051733 [Festuca glaucescens]
MGFIKRTHLKDVASSPSCKSLWRNVTQLTASVLSRCSSRPVWPGQRRSRGWKRNGRLRELAKARRRTSRSGPATKKIDHRRRRATSDHYRTLGLHPNASKSDIKNAYFRLALSYHPDHHAKADAAGRAAAAVWFRRVKDAYEVLYDDRRRAEYDRTIRAGGGYGNRQHGGASPRSSGGGGGTSYSEPEWILKRARARGHGGGAYSSSSGNGNRQGQYGAGASSKSSGGGTSSTIEADSECMWERARTRCHGDSAYSSSTVHGNWQSQSGGTSSSSSGGGTSSSTEPDSGWIWERARTRGHGGFASTSSTGYAHGGT